MTNISIAFGLKSKPNITIDMHNRNNFKLGLGNYLESKLVLVTCYKSVIKCETNVNIFSSLYMKERTNEEKEGERDRWIEILLSQDGLNIKGGNPFIGFSNQRFA